MLDNFEATSDDVPAIGIQSTPVSEGKISIRFIGAIKVVDMDDDNDVDNDDLKLTTAVWHRGMYAYEDGSAIKSASDKESQFAYTYFNDGGAPRTIEQYNTAHGTQYTHFVTYVLKDIPVSTYGTAYLNVNLTVNDTVDSKYAVTTVDRSTQFSYESDRTGYFGVKKTSTGYETFDGLSPVNNSVYSARLETRFNNNESFVIVSKGNDTFKVFDYSNVDALGDVVACEQDENTNFAKPTAGSNFYIMMKKNDSSSDSINTFTSVGPIISETTVEYGLYPQTYVSNSSLVNTLNGLLTTEEPNACGWYYYSGDGNYYTRIQAQIRTNKKRFFKNGTQITKGNYYWFKCEPIVWNILSSSEMFLISNKVLDYHIVQAASATFNYKTCDMRYFLNNDFLATAFAFGNSSIAITDVDNSASAGVPSASAYFCENTLDRVYLPSYQELLNTEYGFSSDPATANAKRKRELTDYAIARGVAPKDETNNAPFYSNYYTRSPSTMNSGKGVCYGVNDGRVEVDAQPNVGTEGYPMGTCPCIHLVID